MNDTRLQIRVSFEPMQDVQLTTNNTDNQIGLGGGANPSDNSVLSETYKPISSDMAHLVKTCRALIRFLSGKAKQQVSTLHMLFHRDG